MLEHEQSARLRIEMVEPEMQLKRIRPCDLRVFLNDVELTTYTELSLSFGRSSGVVSATIELYIDRLDVDADVMAQLVPLLAFAEGPVPVEQLKRPGSDKLQEIRNAVR